MKETLVRQWHVQSENVHKMRDGIHYVVTRDEETMDYTCTCPSFVFHSDKGCKHIRRVVEGREYNGALVSITSLDPDPVVPNGDVATIELSDRGTSLSMAEGYTARIVMTNSNGASKVIISKE